ncbi:hypothetical protein DAPK24_025830 [Pichia kluyveri]|uniref:J domain-containing protein n=1 Tax=Pichia kluyveri TaxID=36015 RepID=A0AAV5R382_PICKL|nr:hypothetical protein DAPK24_025830 [Pichia kluyveri]
MDRSLKKDYDWLLSRNSNAYEILGIKSTSNLSELRKAFREKALLYHPDKNDSSIDIDEKFREVSISYKILNDPSLREEYDTYITGKLKSTLKSPSVNSNVSKFKSDLKKKEDLYKSDKITKLTRDQKISQLSQWFDDYIKKKVIVEQKPIRKESSYDITKKSSIFPKIVQVKWKNKIDINDFEDIIEQLMSVFGPVKYVNAFDENKDSDHYHYAYVAFKSPIGAALASNVDYSITNDIWDSLNLRKSSSLLREVSLVDYDEALKSVGNLESLGSLDYIAFKIKGI